jgi:hypothetical protein
MLGKPGHHGGSKLPASRTKIVADIFHRHGLTFGCLFAIGGWSRLESSPLVWHSQQCHVLRCFHPSASIS